MIRTLSTFAFLSLLVCSNLSAQLIDDFTSNAMEWTEFPASGVWEKGTLQDGVDSFVENQQVMGTNLSGPYLTEENIYIESTELLVPDAPGVDGKVFIEYLEWLDLNTLAYHRLRIRDVESNDVDVVFTKNWTNGKVWNYQSVDISQYAGKTIKIQFQLDVNSGYVNSSRLGIYIDRVSFRTSDVPENAPVALTLEDIALIPGDSISVPFSFDLKLDEEPVQFSISSSNEGVLSAANIKINTSDNLDYLLSVKSLAGLSGNSTITVTTTSGVHQYVTTFDVFLYDEQLLFVDDFESDLMAWIEEPKNAFLWQIGKVNNGPNSGYESENAMGTNLSSNYNPYTGRSGSMVSNTIELPHLTNGSYVLNFDEFQDLESCCGDYARVIIRDSEGQETLLRETRWRENKDWSNSGNFSLAPFEGQEVQLVIQLFMYGSSSRSGSKHAGWFVDNVKIQVINDQIVSGANLSINRQSNIIVTEEGDLKVPLKVFNAGQVGVGLSARAVDTNPIWDGAIDVVGDDHTNWLLSIDVARKGVSTVEVIAQFNGQTDTAHFTVSNLGSGSERDSVALMAVYERIGNASSALGWAGLPMSAWEGVTLNDDGRIIGLNLNTSVKGELDPAIGLLDSLKELHLYGRELTGHLPEEIGALSELNTLYISSARFYGTIPKSIGSLTKLKTLIIGQTSLQGELPQELGNLAELERVVLSWGDFTSEYPGQLFSCSKLRELNTTVTGFYGSFPDGIGNLTNLEELNMRSGGLEGPISAEITGLTKLREMELIGNSFTSLPEGMGAMTSLEKLYLVFNEISDLPADFSEVPNLKLVNFELNNLDNEDLQVLAQIDSLEIMHVGSNNISGVLPVELAHAEKLKSIIISSTKIDSIPEEFVNAPSLEYISARNADLFSIPDFSGNPKIRTLNVQGNHLDFLALEQNRSIGNLTYSGQTSRYPNVEVGLVLGDNYELNSGVQGEYNTYVWSKDGDELVGENAANLTFSNTSITDAGAYQCEVSNDTLNDLIIRSSVFNVYFNDVENQNPVLEDSTIQSELNAYTFLHELPFTDDDGDTLEYSVTGNIRITIRNGHFLYLNHTTLIYEKETELELTVKDNKGGWDQATYTIQWLTENEHLLSRIWTRAFFFEVSESTLPNEVFAQVYTYDSSGTLLNYELTTNTDVFEIDSLTGDLSLAENVYLDYEREYSYSLTISVSNEAGGSSSFNVEISVVKDDFDPCNFNPITADDTYLILENASIGFEIGQLVVTDLDADVFGYRILDRTLPFTIDQYGIITLVQQLDFEIDSVYQFEIQVSDKMGGNAYADVTIDVIEVITGIESEDQSFEVTENSPEGMLVGVVLANEISGGEVSYEVVDPLNTVPFQFANPTDGALIIADSAEVDYEMNESFTFDVKLTALEDLEQVIEVTVDVEDVFEVITNTTSLAELSIEVYPSVFNGYFVIHAESTLVKRYKVFTASGVEILHGEFQGDEVRVNTSGLSSGLYHLEVSSDQGSARTTLVNGGH